MTGNPYTCLFEKRSVMPCGRPFKYARSEPPLVEEIRRFYAFAVFNGSLSAAYFKAVGRFAFFKIRIIGTYAIPQELSFLLTAEIPRT